MDSLLLSSFIVYDNRINCNRLPHDFFNMLFLFWMGYDYTRHIEIIEKKGIGEGHPVKISPIQVLPRQF